MIWRSGTKKTDFDIKQVGTFVKQVPVYLI